MLSSPLWVLGWILIALSQNYKMMLFARIFTGFCVGLVTPSAAVYVSGNFVKSIYVTFTCLAFTVFDHYKGNFNLCSLILINTMSGLGAVCLLQ
jgi:MFS family permease